MNLSPVVELLPHNTHPLVTIVDSAMTVNTHPLFTTVDPAITVVMREECVKFFWFLSKSYLICSSHSQVFVLFYSPLYSSWNGVDKSTIIVMSSVFNLKRRILLAFVLTLNSIFEVTSQVWTL